MTLKSILLGLIVCASAALCHAENTEPAWNSWRGARHDGIERSAFQEPAAWPKKLTVVWQTEVGNGFSSPVCDGTTVYVQHRSETQEFVSAFDAAAGRMLWKLILSEISEPQTHDPAPTPDCGVPGSLFVHSLTGAVFKLNSKTGEIRWKRDLPAEWKAAGFRQQYGVAASPIRVDETVLLPIGNKEMAKAVALKMSDGSSAWELPTSAPGYTSFMPLQLDGKPHLATLLFHELIVLKQDGGKYAPAFSFELKGGGDGNSAMPVPIGDNRVLITSHEATVALTVFPGVAKCEEAWRLEVGGNLSTPVFVNGRIYMFDGQKILSLDPASGKTLSFLEADGQYCALVAWGNVLIARLHDGTLKFIDIKSEPMKLLADYPATDDTPECWSAPMPLAPARLVLRNGSKLLCMTWAK